MLEHPALAQVASRLVHTLTGVGVESRFGLKRVVGPLVEVTGMCRERVLAFGAEWIVRVSHGPILHPPAGPFPCPLCNSLSRVRPRPRQVIVDL